MEEWPHKFCKNETENKRNEIIFAIRKIKYHLRKKFPKSQIILAGSLAYGEAVIREKKDRLEFNSDIDIFVLSNSLRSLKYMTKRFNKKNLIAKTKIPEDKLEIFFIWKPLLFFNQHLVTGKDLDSGRIIIHGSGTKDEIRYNSLKKAYVHLIKAKSEKYNENLAYAGVYSIRAKMCEKFVSDSIFKLKSNLKWLNEQNYFSEHEKKLLEKTVAYRLGKNIKFNEEDMNLIIDIINKIFKEKKQNLNLSYNIQYMYYCIKNHKIPSLLINYPQILLEILYDFANDKPINKVKIKKIFKKNSITEQELLNFVRFNVLRK